MDRNPASDPLLQQLKTAAKNGGKRGPYYDRGMLFVISQIETTGGFTPDAAVDAVYAVHLVENRALSALRLTAKERELATETLSRLGLNMDQAGQYAAGVKQAQTALSAYKRA
jgi:hypothetical protein